MNYFQFISEYKSVFPDNSYDQMMQAWRESGYAPAPQGIEAAGTAMDIDTPSFGPAGYKSRNNVCSPFFDHSNS